MITKRLGYALTLIAVMVLLAGGCGRFQDIRPVSANVESFQPEGFRSLSMIVSVEFDNPAPQVTVSEIKGAVMHSGKVLGRVAIDPFTLEARKQKHYTLKATITLDETQSLMGLMSVVTDDFIDKCTVDISAKASLKSGASRDLGVKELPLSKILNF